VNSSSAELIARRDWGELARILCSLSFIEKYASSGRIVALIAEYDAAIAAIPPTHESQNVLSVLAAGLRHNASFISRYPASTFSTLWNFCWWHDCSERSNFVPASRGKLAPTAGKTSGGPVSRLMESWRSAMATQHRGGYWLRSLLPHARSSSPQLRFELAVDADLGNADAVSVSEAHVAVWLGKGREERKVQVWNRATLQPIATADLVQYPFPDPSVSPDETLCGAPGDGEEGGWGEPLTISNRATGETIASLPIDEDSNLWSVAFSPDGKTFAACGYGADHEGYIYVWDLASRSLKTRIQRDSWVTSIVFSKSGTEILAGSSNGRLEIWSLAPTRLVRSIAAHDSAIQCVAFCAGENFVVSVSDDGKLRAWDPDGDAAESWFKPHPDSLIEAKFSPQGDRLVTRSENGTAWLWDGSTGKPIRCLFESTMRVQLGGDARDCLFVGNHMIVSVAQEGSVWKSIDGERLAEVLDHVFSSQGVAFSPDGRRFAVWRRLETEGIAPITIRGVRIREPHGFEPENVSDPDAEGDAFQISLDADGETVMRKLPDPIVLSRLEAHDGSVTCCAWSADQLLLVSGGRDGMLKIWEWETSTLVASVAVSPTGIGLGELEDDSYGQLHRMRKVRFLDPDTVLAAIGETGLVKWAFRDDKGVETASWSAGFEEYPNAPRFRAEVRDDAICVMDTENLREVASFECGRDAYEECKLVPHPNGHA
jgi:WD40 repeat protein